MRTTSARVRARHALLLVAATSVSIAGSTSAADRHWFNMAPDNSSFHDATQWVEGQVPGASDRAVFNPGTPGQTVRFDTAASNDQLLVPSGNLTFDLAPSIPGYSLGATAAASITIGAASGNAAQLTILRGTLSGTTALLGDAAAASGALALNGPSAGRLNLTDALTIGRAGTGSVALGAAAQLRPGTLVLAAAPGSSGTLTVDGDYDPFAFDSLFTTGGITVGQAGAGTFEFRTGAAQTNYTGGDTILGDQATGRGTVRVGANEPAASPNQRWRAAGAFVVGNAGAGDLTVLPTGVLTSGNPLGVFGSDAARPRVDHPLYVAKLPGSSGTVTVSGSWAHYGPAVLGGTETADGGTATMTIKAGGTFANDDNWRGSTNPNPPAFIIRRNGTLVLDGGTLSAATIDNSHGGKFDFRSGSIFLLQDDLVVGTGGLIGPDVTADTLGARSVRVAADAHLRLTPVGGVATPLLTVEGDLASDGALNADTIRIAASGRLSGNGQIWGYLNVFPDIAIDGTVSPGRSVGRIDARGNVTFSATGTYAAELGPATTVGEAILTSDLLAIEGDLVLAPGSTLDLTSLAGADDSSHLIATYTGTLTGTFDHVTPGYVVDYRPGEIYVATVPEPAALSLFCGGAILACGRRRRRLCTR
jgi:hypothetical protein